MVRRFCTLLTHTWKRVRLRSISTLEDKTVGNATLIILNDYEDLGNNRLHGSLWK